MLIRAADLLPRLADPDWIVFDCRHDLMNHARGPQLYREGHVPGAHFVPVETALSGPKTGTNGRHPLPAPAAFAAFLRQHGVTPATHLVAYDDAGGLYAARLWWLARWVGLTRVSLLDGGFPWWVAAGHPTSTAVPTPVPAATEIPIHPDRAQVLSADEVLARLADPTWAVVDARAADRFRGDVEPIDRLAGHIPGALNRFYKTNLQPDLTFRSPEALRAEFNALLGATPAPHVAHSCGSGITACANIFAMEYAGLPGSKLYAGSWSEWIADPARPVATQGG
jgi:thiosulfate/3-mercaptopyruvate sulfurtransferase